MDASNQVPGKQSRLPPAGGSTPSNAPLRIVVLPGDGVGREVMVAALEVLRSVERLIGGFRWVFEEFAAGALYYQQSGRSMAPEALQALPQADAILLGACGWPEIRYQDGTEIRPQVELRQILDLYAGVRPIRALPGVPSVLSSPQAEQIDFVLIRESTEGFFSSRGNVPNKHAATETMLITRATTTRLMHFAYRLAQRRRQDGHAGSLACVDKANIFSAMAFFRGIWEELAQEYPDVKREAVYVDAMALNLVRCPWQYDVLVMENLCGDILSDLGAGLVGGMGMAPSADIGDKHAVFQPSHGTAPDITGKNMANPTAMILSAKMMCEYLGQRHGLDALTRAAQLIDLGTLETLRSKENHTPDIGGQASTQRVTEQVIENMERLQKRVASHP